MRFVVTSLSGEPGGIYRGFYTQRGRVPERRIGELKNGLGLDRLSSPRFLSNALKLLVHVLAYLLYALFREAKAQIPELKTLEVGTARTRLFKVGALVQATHRRIWFHIASHWPGRGLLAAAANAVREYIAARHTAWERSLPCCDASDPGGGIKIPFGPVPLK